MEAQAITFALADSSAGYEASPERVRLGALADFSAGYRFKLWNDRIRSKVQLNIRDVFEDGRLQAVGVNPALNRDRRR